MMLRAIFKAGFIATIFVTALLIGVRAYGIERRPSTKRRPIHEVHGLRPELPLLQNARHFFGSLKGRVALLRPDLNVLDKKGRIVDTLRIESSKPTIDWLLDRGVHPVIGWHIQRPRDKKTGLITIDEKTSIKPIVEYMEHTWGKRFGMLDVTADHISERGLRGLDYLGMDKLVARLKDGEFDGICIPNVRWFEGEESKGKARRSHVEQLAKYVDFYINDAPGSWQAQASTFDVAQHVPSYAGLLLQQELAVMDGLTANPRKPFVAIFAGAKRTKYSAIEAFLADPNVNAVMLGGLFNTAFLAAKRGLEIKGLTGEDIQLATQLVKHPHAAKLVEFPFVIESSHPTHRVEGQHRIRAVAELKPGDKLGYIYDVHPESLRDSRVAGVLSGAKTILSNHVMGFMPEFPQGTKAVTEALAANKTAQKIIAGGDALGESAKAAPEAYEILQADENCTVITGAGTLLEAFRRRTPWELPAVTALMQSKQIFDLP